MQMKFCWTRETYSKHQQALAFKINRNFNMYVRKDLWKWRNASNYAMLCGYVYAHVQILHLSFPECVHYLGSLP